MFETLRLVINKINQSGAAISSALLDWIIVFGLQSFIGVTNVFDELLILNNRSEFALVQRGLIELNYRCTPAL